MKQSFLVKHKINKKHQFDHCMQNGKCVRIKPFTCFIIANDLPDNRLGVIISKKWHKLAVKRNQLRRWLKEEFRQTIAKKGFDIIIIPYSHEKISYIEVKSLWKTLKLR